MDTNNMKAVLISALLFALVLGCHAVGYRYNSCFGTVKECAQDWTFSYVSCGCVKNGDGGHNVPKFPTGFPVFPRNPFFPVPFTAQPNPVIVQGPPSSQVITVPSQPRIITVPGPNGQPQIIQIPRPPACPRTFICSAGQFFDERQCACTCIQQLQCQSFQTFSFSTCQCEPQGCPNTCNRCERLNQRTCACESLVSCPFGQVPDSNTCQCRCAINQLCNSLQTLNPQTCRCECNFFVATFEREIPGQITPPSFEPGTPRFRTGTRRTATRRTPGGRRRTGRDVEGPEVDEAIVLLREKRRRGTRTRPGTRRPGTPTLTRGTPRLVDGIQEPSTFITETRQVRVCPAGTFQNDVTCTCN